MKKGKFRALSLLELLIAVVLLSVIILGLTGIEIFSRRQVVSAERRVKLQHELAFAVDHITKRAVRTCGNEYVSGADSVVSTAQIGADQGIKFNIDQSGDGIADRWIAYRRNGFDLLFCPDCTNANCTLCNPMWGTSADNIIVAGVITNFTFDKPAVTVLNQNRVRVNVRACSSPGAGGCGTPDNPQIDMSADIKLPSVATN